MFVQSCTCFIVAVCGDLHHMQLLWGALPPTVQQRGCRFLGTFKDLLICLCFPELSVQWWSLTTLNTNTIFKEPSVRIISHALVPASPSEKWGNMPLPFGLKLKRTRRYTVSSKSCLVTRIQLLNGEFVEFTLSVESTGQECLEAVAQRLELREVCMNFPCYKLWLFTHSFFFSLTDHLWLPTGLGRSSDS